MAVVVKVVIVVVKKEVQRPKISKQVIFKKKFEAIKRRSEEKVEAAFRRLYFRELVLTLLFHVLLSLFAC